MEEESSSSSPGWSDWSEEDVEDDDEDEDEDDDGDSDDSEWARAEACALEEAAVRESADREQVAVALMVEGEDSAGDPRAGLFPEMESLARGLLLVSVLLARICCPHCCAPLGAESFAQRWLGFAGHNPALHPLPSDYAVPLHMV